jgi:hypothetical protein
LVVLKWLRQLQQLFYEQSETVAARDLNEYEQYYGTATNLNALPNITMSTVRGKSTQVTDVYYFKPNKERTDVIISLEEWAAMILKSDIPDLLKEAKTFDNDTKKRFKRANKQNKFKFILSDKDYRIAEQDDSEHNIIFTPHLTEAAENLTHTCSYPSAKSFKRL